MDQKTELHGSSLDLPPFLRATSRHSSPPLSNQKPVFRSMGVINNLPQHAFRDMTLVHDAGLLAANRFPAKSAGQTLPTKLDDVGHGAPACPPFLEKNSTFVSSQTPEKVYGVLLSSLKQMDDVVVILADQTKFIIRGRAFENQKYVCFKVNLFSGRSKGENSIVEVQRRSGEGLVFKRFYSSLLDDVEAVVKQPMQPCPNRKLFADKHQRSSSDSALAEPSLSSPSTIKNLIKLASSQCSLNKRQGLSALAEICAKRKQCDDTSILKELDLMGEVKSALASGDTDVVRCAVTIANSFATCPRLSPDILRMLDKLSALLSCSKCPKTLRQIGCLLSCMSEKNAALMKCPRLRETLRKLDCESCGDRVLAAAAKKSLDNINREVKDQK